MLRMAMYTSVPAVKSNDQNKSCAVKGQSGSEILLLCRALSSRLTIDCADFRQWPKISTANCNQYMGNGQSHSQSQQSKQLRNATNIRVSVLNKLRMHFDLQS